MAAKQSSVPVADGRRRALRWLAWPLLVRTGAVRAGNDQEAGVEVWVVLSLPELASLPRQACAEREALQRRVQAQQDQVMAALCALGAVELGRVQVLRNALVVRVPQAQLAAARRLPGVRSVSAVRDSQRGPVPPPA